MSLTAEESVVVRNIWYMLAYAYRVLDMKDYARISSESFDNLDKLLGAIMAMGMSSQRKRGFERGYVDFEDDISGIKGRVDLIGTVRNKMSGMAKAHCYFDDYSADTYKNRILKTSARLLLRSEDLDDGDKASIKRTLLLMGDVGTVDPKSIDWSRLTFDRNNRPYQLLMAVCYMVVSHVIANPDPGPIKFANFMDNQKLHALYQAFVLEYFKRHYRKAISASAKEIKRKTSVDAPDFLPGLHTDITLSSRDRTLIIDTKCYGQILKSNQFGNEILSPDHLNQIQSYVFHEQYQNPKKVEGMLLYALTDRDAEQCISWEEIGYRFHVRTLDLGQPFDIIASQLDEIAALVSS